MSEWTKERHAEARKALEEDMSQWGMEYGGGALDEIERQRAQAALRRIPSPFTLKKMADAAAREMFKLDADTSPTLSQFVRGSAVMTQALAVWLKEGTK